MGLSIRTSQTARCFMRERDIENAQRLYLRGWEKLLILEATELTEDEFEKEVLMKYTESKKISSIKVAQKLYLHGMEDKKIMEITELTDIEFRNNVIDLCYGMRFTDKDNE